MNTATEPSAKSSPGSVKPTRNLSLAGLQPTDPAAREVIRHSAYALWESEGRPEGRALDHWLEAESVFLRKDGDQAG